jgi:hypothetical protein
MTNPFTTVGGNRVCIQFERGDGRGETAAAVVGVAEKPIHLL